MGAGESKSAGGGGGPAVVRYGRTFRSTEADGQVDGDETWEIRFYRDCSFSLRAVTRLSRSRLWREARLQVAPDRPNDLEDVMELNYFGGPGCASLVRGDGDGDGDDDGTTLFARLLELGALEAQRERAKRHGAFTLEAMEPVRAKVRTERVEYRHRGLPAMVEVDDERERVWSFPYYDGLVDAEDEAEAEEAAERAPPGLHPAPVPKPSTTSPDYVAAAGTLDFELTLPPRSSELRLSLRRLRLDDDNCVGLAKPDGSREVVVMHRV